MTTATGFRTEKAVDLDALEARFEAAVKADAEESFRADSSVRAVSAPPRRKERRASAAGSWSTAGAGLPGVAAVVVQADVPAAPRDHEPDDLLQETSGRSMPDSVAMAMIIRRSLQTAGPLVLCDAAALSLAGMAGRLAIGLLLHQATPLPAWAAPLALLPLIIGYWMSGLYTEIWVHPAVELRQLSHLTTLGLLAAAAGGFLNLPISLWCLAAWPAALVLVPVFRTAVRYLLAERSWWGYPTLVIGSGRGADDVARALQRDTHSGLRPVLVTDPSGVCRSSIVPVINDRQTLDSMMRARLVRHAVVSLPEMSSARLTQTLDNFSTVLPHLLVLSDHTTLPLLWTTSRRCGRLSGIEVRNGVLLATLQGVKRAIDLTVAVTTLVLSSPLLVAVAILVKQSSPGPIFYGHWRIGRHGRRFKAWKFRTMRQNSESILRQHLAENPQARLEWEKDHKLRDDPRVTPFGRVARKLSLDELPQLWNVLRGDMGLVGPRPIVDAEVWKYGSVFPLYTTVKPGITGMWQVSGRNDLDYDERVQLDQFYVRHWSPWLDMYILAKTVIALLNRGGAY